MEVDFLGNEFIDFGEIFGFLFKLKVLRLMLELFIL